MNRSYRFPLALIVLSLVGLSGTAALGTPGPGQAAPGTPPSAEAPGRMRAPDFEVRDLDGKSVKLSELRGKVVVIDFWATWCGPCVRGMPVSAAVTKEFGDRVVFVPVDVDDRETTDKVKSFAAKKGWSFPLYLGGKAVGAKYGVSGIPHTVIVAADGTVVAKHVGFSSESEWKELLSKDITAALAIK